MTFSEFKSTYDRPGSVILLEGKRDVKPEDKPKLTKLGEMLCKKLLYSEFRSGNADGADYFFCEGVANIDSKRLELILPYTSHKKSSRLTDRYHSIENIDMVKEPNVVYQAKANLKNRHLINKYVEGDRKKPGMQGSYLLRNTVKVTGTSGIGSASFAIFYDDLKKPESGGTGHTMLMCKNINIPYIDQKIWMTWLT
jgi:hypothetical protein